MSDDSAYEVIEGSAEGTEVTTLGYTGDPADDEPYDDDATDLEEEPEDTDPIPLSDGEGTLAPEDAEFLTGEHTEKGE